jgi:hypothetical protein
MLLMIVLVWTAAALVCVALIAALVRAGSRADRTTTTQVRELVLRLGRWNRRRGQRRQGERRTEDVAVAKERRHGDRRAAGRRRNRFTLYP